MKKRIGIIFGALLCANVAYAETINVNWLNENGTTYDTTTCTVGGDLNVPTAPTKRGHTFRGWAFYTPIAYIQTTGTQLIDPLITPNNNFKFKAKFAIDGLNEGKFSLFASWVSDCEGIGFYEYQPDNTSYFYFLGRQSYPNMSTGTIYEVDINASKSDPYIIINGTRYNHTMTCDTTLNLPAMKMLKESKGKLYYFQIYDNGTLVRDMIPVLDENGVPCMLDKVGGQFYYNAGTGSFTAGPAL